MNYRIRISETKQGFTLAEVLITLTIIGVIAALTIPALITNIQDAQYRTAWRSTASDLSQATRKLALENAGSLVGVFSNSNDARDKLLNYITSVQKCNVNAALGPGGCWASQTYFLGGDNFDWWDMSVFSRAVLNNGILLAAYEISGTCTENRPAKHNGCVEVGVDVNGLKGPNTVGKDIFFGYITSDGSFEAFGKTGDQWTTDDGFGCDLVLRPHAEGWTCSAQYLRQ